ncbi:MAG TPA: hypothetical protein VE973_00030, partial [Candidatus Limnocylindria bacterium]|nr:hypothetical protein [Candidatus Limnocylindria bacterium]
MAKRTRNYLSLSEITTGGHELVFEIAWSKGIAIPWFRRTDGNRGFGYIIKAGQTVQFKGEARTFYPTRMEAGGNIQALTYDDLKAGDVLYREAST